ncbi:UDP-glucose flavonoid 3-o-glucosyltransferase 6 [Phtheirospermum japonicum]|uniref:Glycosyltransferase n=1 Tax=Phtheirospermum japonicum TaxID=374723 RepID=A0A830CG41_9LAMI|nr:UDP-glucose flavonoid 3-o-glucosyltransferase 6 [Phtheirospermum japonicum]
MAKLLLDRNEHLSITIIIMKLPIDTKTSSTSKKNPPDDNSRINYFEITPQHDSRTRFMESQTATVRNAVMKMLVEGPKPSRLAGFVVDMFCTAMIDVANELGAPSYIFFTSSAATLGLMFRLQGLSDYQNQDLAEYGNNPDAAISVPTYVNPVPAKVWPSLFLEKESGFLNLVRKFRETKGIIINTFLEFEPHAVKSLSGDQKIPPVYPVGPIIQTDNESQKHDGIIKWLDEQPDSSVVFLCFGSNGSFETDQVNEIALALGKSRHRFLWSLRKPPPGEKMELPGEYENPGDILPDGFLERTVGIGKVIGWAPQMAVLSHPSVGGFVSHCGWNSILESVWCNVPVAAWPLAAEQQANAFQLVKEFGIAAEIKMDYRKDCNVIVPAEKIEKAIRELMGPENEGRAKVKVLNEKSRVVMAKGGSSYDFLGRFIDDVMDNIY